MVPTPKKPDPGDIEDSPRGLPSWLALGAGPGLALFVYVLIGALEAPLDDPGRATAAIAVWMATWWLTEAVPLAATALLPIAIFPVVGVATIETATAPYANSLIFLFLGGFLLGLGLQRSGLQQRIALVVLKTAGSNSRRLVAAFMVATAFLSMWISNTAAVIMLIPIAASLLSAMQERIDLTDSHAVEGMAALGTVLMLSIAYASSIGGVATLIGTPPNLILAAFVKERFGVQLDMVSWLAIGLPYVIIMLPCAWLYLTRVAVAHIPNELPDGGPLVAARLRALGPMSGGEYRALAVFSITVACWILRPFIIELTGLDALSDAGIAVMGALVLFALPYPERPGERMLDWETAKSVPWHILLLFGGGLSLAAAIGRHGVDAWLASGLNALSGSSTIVIIVAVVTLVVFLTEISSNTAVTATLLPVLAASAVVLGVAPGPLLVAAAMAASCAFMLPVATPPNAIAFGSGHVTIAQMARAGFALNLVSIIAITLLVSTGAELPLTR